LKVGSLIASDGSVVVRGTPDGVLVLERASETIPPTYWVHYLRRK
jgi:hypothetical protein